jgi:branched-chain amino acid transport system ATP-binding protein
MAPDMTVLAARGMRKSFGALAVTQDVSLDVRAGEVHALIGPNGAGKSSLLGQLAGTLAPDGGSVWLDGAEVTRLPPHARARLGLARTFQVSALVGSFSAAANVALAVQARAPRPLLPFRKAAGDLTLERPARAALEAVGLAGRAAVPAAALSHGERRALELAAALALAPRVVLLDEPLAGMGHEEGRRIVALLAGLKGRFAMLLVEHDMDAVFALAERVSVLVAGRVIATGPPASVRADPAVRAAYLGEPA